MLRCQSSVSSVNVSLYNALSMAISKTLVCAHTDYWQQCTLCLKKLFFLERGSRSADVRSRSAVMHRSKFSSATRGPGVAFKRDGETGSYNYFWSTWSKVTPGFFECLKF